MRNKVNPATIMLDSLFAPDISFKWDKFAKCYIVKGENEAGHEFVKKMAGVKMKNGKIVPKCNIEYWYDAALKLGLCCERTDDENDETFFE